MRMHSLGVVFAIALLAADVALAQYDLRQPVAKPPESPNSNDQVAQDLGVARQQPAIYADGPVSASLDAVRSATAWLATHQMANGSWNFDHTRCPSCQGRCHNTGKLVDAPNAATGLALLALLGHGHTTNQGKCQAQVKAGLEYLISHMKATPQGGSLHESGGTMYSQGIATLALCEAYAMTGDEKLKEPAQKAVDFICFAQDPAGGGWRYMPRQKGDTSVTGWQVAALLSAHRAGLHVPPENAKKAMAFLDSVQAEGGAKYGYITPGVRPTTTAIGLLCRLRLGGDRDNAALARGVHWIAELGPSVQGIYHIYYGQQLMLQWDDADTWRKWNDAVLPLLLECQSTEGHEAGSWYFTGGDVGTDRGGRLYSTAMAVMALEVYYRHLPIYEKITPENCLPTE